MVIYLLLFQFIQLINLLRHLSNGVLVFLLQTRRESAFFYKNPRTKRAGLNRTEMLMNVVDLRIVDSCWMLISSRSFLILIT
jgi:hypothetical protein